MSGLKAISIDQIPEKKPFGQPASEGTIYIRNLIDEFVKMDARAAMIDEDENGKPFTSKNISHYAGAATSWIKKNHYSMEAVTRGKRLYLSKVRITKIGADK